jgi:hypothetical protein
MSNLVLSQDYVEVVHRLALGIEPIDAAMGQRLARPVQVVLDGVPESTRNGGASGLDRATSGLKLLNASSSGRFVVLHRKQQVTAFAIRLSDAARRFVPRRLSYEVPAEIESLAGRVRRPALFAGAAYDVSGTATGLRGRVLWSAAPDSSVVRWARVEATVNGEVVGRAHGDDRGEFLLLLHPLAAGFGDLAPLELEVTVFAPAEPPLPDTAEQALRDPLWDLPLERLSLGTDPDRVSSGEALPDGYAATASSRRTVSFELGRLRSDEPAFSMAP